MLQDIPEIRKQYDSFHLMDEGGMGSIYRVRHRLLDEFRVIKTVRADVQSSLDVQARFLREAKVAAKLRHPNIASIYDFSVAEDGTAWIVMEYIEGINLFEYYRGGNRLSLSQVRLVANEGLKALSYLHAMSFVHRDIASDNLMLTQDSRGQATVKLIDLGLAKSLQGSDFKTRTGLILGKVRYISPEQIQQGAQSTEVDARSDLYSFGVVLYELLTGRLPIDATDDVSMIAGHLYQQPTSFEISDPEGRIPPALRAALMSSLEKEPEQRFASAEAFLSALELGFESLTANTEDQAESPAVTPGSAEENDQRPTREPTRILLGTEPTRRPPDQAVLQAEPDPQTRTDRSIADRGAKERTPRWGLVVVVIVVAIALSSWGLLRGDRESAPPSATEAPDGRVGGITAESWGKYHALVIGNDHYRELPELRTAVNDARAIADLLERHYDFEVDRLEDATREQIMNALYDLESSLTGRDNLLIYYAGHGFRQHQREYWQPVDAEEDDTTYWLSTEHEISAAVDRMSARHVLVVADSCYAGSTGKLSPSQAPVEELIRKPSRLVLSSGSLSPVLDDSGDGHSIFATVFLEVLRNNDGPAGVVDLFGIIDVEVPKEASRAGVEQSPTLSALPLASDGGGMFFFVPHG